jgi:phage repressor protein C with HTH and peptisase S24 domain
VIGFPQAREGDIALVVEGDSMEPWYPPETNLLVRPGEFPEDGDIVIAKLDGGPMVCRRYERVDGVITLRPLNEGKEGETIQWRIREGPNKILWMWPVLAIMRDERRVRHEADRPR